MTDTWVTWDELRPEIVDQLGEGRVAKARREMLEALAQDQQATQETPTTPERGDSPVG